MSFKEVTQLRKDGRLEDATTMAREDLSRVRDEWSCKALFWCLHEESKTATIERLTQLAEEMQNLLETIGNDDVAVSCMQRIEKRLIPHAEMVRQASAEAKSSRPTYAYNRILNIFNKGELHESLHNDFAWIIWRTLHADQSEDVEYRKGLLEVYKQLNIERPSILHSLILNEAVRVEKAWPQMFMFTEFVAWWGLENLNDDDWERFKTDDGKSLMSIVEKMIYLYTREIQSIEGLLPSEKFIQVLNCAIGKWPKDDNILRCKAILIAKQGNKEESITLYKKIIALTSGQKPYVWIELANLVDDIDLKIGLLSKVLQLKVQEEFLGKCRAQLAQLLYSKGLHSNAIYEVNKVKATYAANSWNLPSQVRSLMQMLPVGAASFDNTTQYAVWATKADEYLYADLPSTYMVKVSHKEEMVNRNGKQQKVIKWTLISGTGDVEGIKPRKYNLSRAQVGDCFEVKKNDGRIVSIVPTKADNIAWLKRVQGTISINNNRGGKPFGFVDNCYVPGSVIKNVRNGTMVEAVAILQDNKWRCVFIKNM